MNRFKALPRRHWNIPFYLLAIVLAASLAACDTATGVMADQVTLQGTVTDAQGFATDGTWAGVQGATVTAYAIGQDGQLRPLRGQATTDAQGRYTLMTDITDRPVRIQAVPAGHTEAMYATTIEAGGFTQGTVQAAPMTAESVVQADVYNHLLTEDPNFSLADVHAHIGPGAAASVHEGHMTARDLAASVRAGVEAERAFAMHQDGGGLTNDAVERTRVERERAFADFRTQAASATTPEARLDAETAWLDAYARGYDAAGLSPMQQGHAATAGAAAGARVNGSHNPEAAFHASHRARSLAALSTSYGIEDEFRTAGATQARLDGMRNARLTHQQDLRGALDDDQFFAADDAYHETVGQHLAAHGEFTPAQIGDARAATRPHRLNLDAAVRGAGDSAGVAEAFASYYPAAAGAAHGALGGATGEQSVGGNVVGAMGATARVH
jgi:hypothetical protein